MVDAKAITAQLEELMKKLPKQADTVLDDLTKKTKQPKVHIFGGGLAILSALIVFMIPQCVLFDLVAGVYPAYASLKMIAGATYSAEGDLWTTYWVLFFLIRALSPLLDIFLSFLPFYNLAKLVAMVYLYQGCGTPQPGAKLVLEKVLKPKVFPLLTAAAAAAPAAEPSKGK